MSLRLLEKVMGLSSWRRAGSKSDAGRAGLRLRARRCRCSSIVRAGPARSIRVRVTDCQRTLFDGADRDRAEVDVMRQAIVPTEDKRPRSSCRWRCLRTTCS